MAVISVVYCEGFHVVKHNHTALVKAQSWLSTEYGALS